jgi:hypothetical protein
MSAITGIYHPAKKVYGQWAVDWLHGWDRWTTPRHHLAVQLQAIRKEYGSHEAIEFRNYLLWLGVYPVKVRPRP